MKDLLQIREEIDRVDSEITALYQKRMQLTGEVAAYKIQTGKKVFDKEREREKLNKLSSLVPDSFLKHGIRELFEHIMSISRKRQYQLLTEHGMEVPHAFTEVDKISAADSRIVFQGVEGAYAHIAMQRYFGMETDSFHVDSWREAMEALKNGAGVKGLIDLPVREQIGRYKYV